MDGVLEWKVRVEVWRSFVFVLATSLLALVAHDVAYLTHEYAHSVMAWSLGWMQRPFGIDYGPATVYNILFLGDVSDNVDYTPIFASGHGVAAAVIALSGPFLGNGALYFAVYALASMRWMSSRRYLLMFLYWLALMCAANVWSYVPIRAITTHADIALAANGFGISTLVLFPFVMIPSIFITGHFLTRMFPAVYRRIAAGSAVNLAVLIAFTGFWYFSFFGGDGIGGSYGLVPQILSITSRYLLFPLCVAYLSARHMDWARDES